MAHFSKVRLELEKIEYYCRMQLLQNRSFKIMLVGGAALLAFVAFVLPKPAFFIE